MINMVSFNLSLMMFSPCHSRHLLIWRRLSRIPIIRPQKVAIHPGDDSV
jgi:hypothetical protein